MVYSLRMSLAVLATLLLASLANGLAITYCSSENTAGNFQAIYSNFQSNGACSGSCADYAFAVLQGGNCWCSDYAPENQVTTYDCNEQCPGYPYDWCGSQSAGLFGYYQLTTSPSGTAGGGAVTPPTTSSKLVPPTSSSLSSETSTPDPPAPTSPTQVYTSVTTVTGQVKTIVVTPSSSSTSDPSLLGQGATNSGGLSTGKVVGIVLGVALSLGLVIGFVVWFWLRRKHRNQSRASSQNGAYGSEGGNVSRTTPSRQVSQMSSSGLLGKAPRILTGGFGGGNGNGTNLRSPDTLSSNIDRRSLGTDQRLNPYALYSHEEARLSSVSLQDNQDYSRQLRIANPD